MKRTIRIISNKYFLVTAFMLVILTFFDRFSLIRRMEDEQELHRLQAERDYYKEKTEEVTKQKEELFSDSKKLEKFARERYYMKKDNEDVFIVEQ